MSDELKIRIDRFSRAFLPIMHMFHNLAGEVVKLTDFSLAQYRVLMLVFRRGSVSVNQLKNNLNIAQSTASEMLDRLVKQGFLNRSKDPADRRLTLFSLSAKADQVLHDHLSSIGNIYQNVLSPLETAEQEQLVAAFEQVMNLMQKSASLRTK
ncbi:MAG: MarR family transcriptional regulator [Calditrichia bacterium]